MNKILMAALGGTLAGALITTQFAGPLIAQTAGKTSSVYEQLDLFGDVFDQLVLDNFITHSSILMKRDAFLKSGGYDETLKTTCDWDLWLRMSASGCRFQGTPAPLTHYRWRATSNSRNHDRTCRDRLNVLQNALCSPRARQTSLLIRQKAIARVWQTSAWFVAEKDDRKALNWYLRSVLHRPYSIRGWKEVTRCCLHLCGISRRRIKRMLKRQG